MRTRFAVLLAALLVDGAHGSAAQDRPAATLVGSWTLRAVEEGRAAAGVRVTNPRGLLVLDATGHVCEIATTADLSVYTGARATPQEALAAFLNYTGFWGSYRLDGVGRITYRPEAAVNPNLDQRDVVRSYELEGERLTITAGAGEPLNAGTRWVWTRVPPVDGISEAHRRISGFWRHVSERSIATATGAVLSEVARGPSVIAYTPSGFMCVHFPRAGRTRFSADMPTPDEAKTALTGYTSYIAAFSVHPGFILHHQLSTLAPAPATSLQRFFEFQNDDAEVTYRFPPAVVGGAERRTQIVLRRLSGVADLMPDSR